MEGDLFDQYLAARANILDRFGLPESEEFLYLLATDSILTEAEAEEIIAELHQVASVHLLSPVRREVQVLQDAQHGDHNPFNVLPEIGISTHVYTLFVYDAILLKKRDTVENVWATLKKTQQHDVLDSLGRLYSADSAGAEIELSFLIQSGLNYLDEFLASASPDASHDGWCDN